MNYKEFSFFEKDKYDKSYGYENEEYVPQIIDLARIYEDIQRSFEQKNSSYLTHSLQILKEYLQNYEIRNIEEFQDILFPVLREICENTENDELALYGFQFISFIMKSDVYSKYIPLFTQPNFFDFCFKFLTNSNHLIIFWALDNIENFVHLHIEARDYAMTTLTVEYLVESFILNMDFFNEEENEFDIQSKASTILQCYTSFQIDETNADKIFEICNLILGDEPQYQVLYESGLWTAFNLIQANKKYVTQEFIQKIDKFYFSSSTEHIIPLLKIIRFIVSHGVVPPNLICKNFISLFFHNDKKIGKLSLDCLSILLKNQEKDTIKSLIKNNFLIDLDHLLKGQKFSTKVRAAEIVCLLIENCGTELCKLICHQGLIHKIFILFELEMDDITIRTLRALIEICKKMHSPFVPNEDEKQLFDELLETGSEEISDLAIFFVNNFSTSNKQIAVNKSVADDFNQTRRKGPNIMIKKKEETIPPRSRMRLWNKPMIPEVTEEEEEEEFHSNKFLTDLSRHYYQQNDGEEEEEYDDHDRGNYDY